MKLIGFFMPLLFLTPAWTQNIITPNTSYNDCLKIVGTSIQKGQSFQLETGWGQRTMTPEDISKNTKSFAPHIEFCQQITGHNLNENDLTDYQQRKQAYQQQQQQLSALEQQCQEKVLAAETWCDPETAISKAMGGGKAGKGVATAAAIIMQYGSLAGAAVNATGMKKACQAAKTINSASSALNFGFAAKCTQNIMSCKATCTQAKEALAAAQQPTTNVDNFLQRCGSFTDNAVRQAFSGGLSQAAANIAKKCVNNTTNSPVATNTALPDFKAGCDDPSSPNYGLCQNNTNGRGFVNTGNNSPFNTSGSDADDLLTNESLGTEDNTPPNISPSSSGTLNTARNGGVQGPGGVGGDSGLDDTDGPMDAPEKGLDENINTGLSKSDGYVNPGGSSANGGYVSSVRRSRGTAGEGFKFDLKKFLPKMAQKKRAAKARKIAMQKMGIHKAHASIWILISKKYQKKCAQNKLYCN
ncbi:MAG: hypothetical protein D6797_00325 [Bdellovibrio sp.]|nr:MAG: hypothetical protein D6797_00325 [Bdellovibrio sp.]